MQVGAHDGGGEVFNDEFLGESRVHFEEDVTVTRSAKLVELVDEFGGDCALGNHTILLRLTNEDSPLVGVDVEVFACVVVRVLVFEISTDFATRVGGQDDVDVFVTTDH